MPSRGRLVRVITCVSNVSAPCSPMWWNPVMHWPHVGSVGISGRPSP